jgi:CRP-like cAMP-binding protein
MSIRPSPSPLTAPLERLLSSFGDLDQAALDRVRSSFTHASETAHAQGVELARDGRSAGPRLLTQGWIARGVHLADGRRQIVDLHLPGEVVRANAHHGDLAVWAATDARTACAVLFWREAERSLRRDDDPLGNAWAAVQADDIARLIRHVVRLGRLSAYERTAHLLLDLRDKQRRSGAPDPLRLELPIAQEILADMLGLSTVHMNRTLQELRRSGLIEYRGGWVDLCDLEGLRRAAQAPLGEKA